jgi:alkylation response protein AidB-like acyl-CoA dehydrogenase
MDFNLSDEQVLLKQNSARMLADACPTDVVRQAEDDGDYAADLWRDLSDLGWLSLGISEDGGGAGGTIFDQMLLAEEFGKVLAPVPYVASNVVAAAAIEGSGNAQAIARWLPPVASGSRIATLAIAESDTLWDTDGITLAATANGDGYLLDGEKLFVLDGVFADDIVVGARSSEGVVLAIVPIDASGVTVERMDNISGDGQASIRFERVAVDTDQVIATGDAAEQALTRAFDHACLALCGSMLGAAQVGMDMAVEYAKDRVQFGRAIGGFQAIQHKLATMMKELESARAIIYSTAWQYSLGNADSQAVSMAKAWMNDASDRSMWEAHQIHAGVAYMMEFDLQLYTRRCKSWEVLFGDTRHHRVQIGNALRAPVRP